MLIVRDESKFRTPSVCRRGRTALNLSVWQDSSWSDMSPLSGEKTTTNGFDGRLFSFLVRATTIAIWSVNKDKRFPMPVRES